MAMRAKLRLLHEEKKSKYFVNNCHAALDFKFLWYTDCYVLVYWVEEGTVSTVPSKNIDGELAIGRLCSAKYDKKSYPAKIAAFGK